MADAIEHGRAVLGTIFRDRSVAALDHALQHLTPEYFTDTVQAALFTFAQRYYQHTQAVLPKDKLDDILRGKPPGTLLMYEEYYDSCCDSAVNSPGEFRWAVQQLGELAAERTTGEAIAVAMEILTKGKHDGQRELKGSADARAYLATALTEAAGTTGGMEAVDWHQLWTHEPEEPDWLCEPLIESGQTVSLYSIPGTGKSLIALELAAGLASGRPVLGNPAAEPVNITYIDAENRRRDILRRLKDMGYGPTDLGRLRFYSFPDLEPLDTAAGGARLVRQAVADKAALVLIDTTSRVIEGAENDADTFNRLYRHAIEPLRRAGIAVLRLDHPGKDPAKGARGSSAKRGDVDAEWELSAEGGDEYVLRCRKDRAGQAGDEPVRLRRRTAPLRHEVVSSVVSTKAQRLLLEFSRLGVTAQTSTREAQQLVRAAGLKASRSAICEAVKQLKAEANRDAPIDFGDDDGSEPLRPDDLGAGHPGGGSEPHWNQPQPAAESAGNPWSAAHGRFGTTFPNEAAPASPDAVVPGSPPLWGEPEPPGRPDHLQADQIVGDDQEAAVLPW